MTTLMTLPLREVIDAVRAVPKPRKAFPSIAQLRLLIDDVAVRSMALDDIADQLTFAEFSHSDLLRFLEEFGKYRARVKKNSGERATPVAWSDTGALFPIPTPELNLAREKFRKQGRLPRKSWPNGLPRDLLMSEGELFCLPPGFLPEDDHKRNIVASILALGKDPVTDAEITRFAERHLTDPSTELSADHVLMLHWLTVHGLGEKVLELVGLQVDRTDDTPTIVANEDSARHWFLARLLVDAYDLLEVARADALDGVRTLLTGDTELLGVAADAARKARWIAPAELGRLEKVLVAASKDPSNERLTTLAERQLKQFRIYIRSNPSTFALMSVEQLSSAHLAQILPAVGLGPDDGDDKVMAGTIRDRLISMGLVNDLDREVPEGLRAHRAGRLDEFFASRTARLEGDPDWKSLYEAPVAVTV